MSTSTPTQSDEEADEQTLEDRLDQLEAENQQLRERINELEDENDGLEQAFETLQENFWSLEDAVYGDSDEWSAATAEMLVDMDGGLVERVEDLEAGAVQDNSNVSTNDLSHFLPLHRMVRELRTDGGTTLDKSKKRAARLFQRFIRAAAGESGTGVDTSGQKYTVNTSQAEEILEGDDDEEDLLADLSRASYSKVVGRTFVNAQSWTKTEGAAERCDCHEASTDGSPSRCRHGLMDYRSGKPNTLAVSKHDLHEYLGEIEEAVSPSTVSDTDVKSADDATNEPSVAEDLDEETSENDVRAEMDELMTASNAENEGSDNVVRSREELASDSHEPR